MNKILIIACTILISVLSCSSKVDTSKIIGKWKVIEFSANTPDLSPAVIDAGRTESLSSHYSFFKNGDSNLKSNYYKNGKERTWIYNSTSNVLTMQNKEKNEDGPESYTIESLNDNKMIWLQDLGELGSLKLTLIKELN